MRDRKLEEYLQNSLEQKIQPIRLEETIQLCTEIVKKQAKIPRGKNRVLELFIRCFSI